MKKLLLAILLIAVFLPGIYSQTKVTHTIEQVSTKKISVGPLNYSNEKAKIKDQNTNITTSNKTVCVGVGASTPGVNVGIVDVEAGAEIRQCATTKTVISNPSKSYSTISSYNANISSPTPKVTHTTEVILPVKITSGPGKLSTENSIIRDDDSGVLTYKNKSCAGVGLDPGIRTPVIGGSIGKDKLNCTTVETVISNASKSNSTINSSAPRMSSTTTSAAKISYAPPVNSGYATPIKNTNIGATQSYATTSKISSTTPIKNTTYNSNVSSIKRK